MTVRSLPAFMNSLQIEANLRTDGGADLTVKIGKDDTVRLVTRRIFEASGVSLRT